MGLRVRLIARTYHGSTVSRNQKHIFFAITLKESRFFYVPKQWKQLRVFSVNLYRDIKYTGYLESSAILNRNLPGVSHDAVL